jgi:hypothetical protein
MKVKHEVFANIGSENLKASPELQCLIKVESLLGRKLENSELMTGKKGIDSFMTSFMYKYKESRISYKYELLMKFHERWMQKEVILFEEKKTETNAGRPKNSSKSYDEVGVRAKRMKVSNAVNSLGSSSEMYLKAAELSAKLENNPPIEKNVKLLRKSLPILNDYENEKKSFKIVSDKPTKLSVDYTLMLFLKASLTVHQYKVIQQGTKAEGFDIFPSYDSILSLRKTCRPESTLVRYTENKVEISLKNLVGHISKRLVNYKEKEIIEEMNQKNLSSVSFNMIHNIGFDGSSGFSLYNQQYEDPNNVPVTKDSNVFLKTLTPLSFSSEQLETSWRNNYPHSSNFVSILGFEYVKETTDHTLDITSRLKMEISDLEQTVMTIDDGKKIIEINHDCYITAVDGKCLHNMLGSNAYSRCPFCNASPTQMNDISNINTIVFSLNPDMSKRGISQLHALLQTTRFLYNLGCRLEVGAESNQWAVKSYRKRAFERRQQKIKDDFVQKLSVYVDHQTPNTKGCSLTGNVCRKIFKHLTLSSEILGIDIEIMERFKIILIVISSKSKIKIDPFQEFCHSTYRLLMSKYPWCSISSTVHKILIHSCELSEALPLSLGYFGEEGTERKNKEIRNSRLRHARKVSRLANITDVANRAWESSDILISSQIHHKKNKIPSNYSENVARFLVFDHDQESTLHQSFEEGEESDDEDNEDYQ